MELEINDYKLIECVGVKDQRRLYKFKCKVFINFNLNLSGG